MLRSLASGLTSMQVPKKSLVKILAKRVLSLQRQSNTIVDYNDVTSARSFLPLGISLCSG